MGPKKQSYVDPSVSATEGKHSEDVSDEEEEEDSEGASGANAISSRCGDPKLVGFNVYLGAIYKK